MTDPLSSEKSNKHTVSASVLTQGPYRIALLCGGKSNEREISFASASNVESALLASGHEVHRIDTANPSFIQELQELQPDVAFIGLHGKGGEDGLIQAMMELMDIPYTGSGVLASALALDKNRTKIIYESLGLKTAPWCFLRRQEKNSPKASVEQILSKLSLPLVVKPSDEGSSVGITIVKEREALADALRKAFDTGADVLVEQFIAGTEITVSVLGADELKALPAIEIIPKNEYYDYESKYAQGGSEHVIPARLQAPVLEEAYRVAVEAHRGLDCFGVSRTDMIVDAQNTVWVIETNTIPGMTSTSLLPDAARHVNISNQELYEMFVIWALQRAEDMR